MKLPINVSILFAILILSSSIISAGEILIKESSNISEIIIKVPPELVKDYSYKGDTATITFSKKFNLNLKEYNQKVVKEITKNNNTLTIKANPWSSVFVAKEKDQLRIVIANNPKGNIPVNINTAGAIPVEDQTYKNEESEKLLSQIKQKIRENDYEAVIPLTDKLIEKNPLDKYGEEALFYQGVAYLELGKESDKALFSAASTFDEFTRKFPKSRLLPEAMLKSAETKEKLGFKNEAIFVYQEMIKNVKDERYLNIAYTKIGQLYNELGQSDRALKYFTDYLQKTKPENSPIYGYVGSIYAEKGDFTKAEEYFSKYKPRRLEDVVPETLYWMAATYEKKGDEDTALKLYTTFYNRYSDNKLTDMAMYKAGELLLKKEKKDLAIDILKDTKNKFSQKKGGILAAIKMAELTLPSQDPEYWSVYLKDAMSNDIDISASIKATKLYISSLINYKRYDEAIREIDKFEKKFPDTPESKELISTKEEIYFKLAKENFDKGSFDKAIYYADKILSEFPQTKHLKEIQSLKEDVAFSKIKLLYDNKKYAETIKQLETYLTQNKSLMNKDKWYKLWEDALYAYINTLKADPVKFGFNARQFITLFPNSNKVPELKSQITKNIQKEFDEIIKSNDHYSIVVFYQKNRQELDATDKKDFYIAKVAYALYMIGEKDKAAAMIKNTKVSNDETELVKFMLNITPNRFNINTLSEEQLKKIIDEISQTNVTKAYQLALSYKKNPSLSVKYAIDILEKMNESDRNRYIPDFIKLLEKQPDNTKKLGYKIYYKAAERSFISKDYKQAISYYQNYLKYAPKDDPNQAEALYFLGKSYINTGNNDLGVKFLNDLTKRFPNSQYTTLAKSEVEDIKWKTLRR